MLGSLRVRQDFLIAQGFIEAYKDGKNPDPRMLEMALARLRQLSAHEVGHTIGLTHNFAASYNDRASVMDYPHPYIFINKQGEIDFSESYDVGIGEWDKRTIIYGYKEFGYGANEAEELKKILTENNELGLKFISDQDARPPGGAHLWGHLWDNRNSPIAEMQRLMKLRKQSLENFGMKNIPEDAPMATLENVLVPLYLAHRYQVEAVSKFIGGVDYTYAVNGDDQPSNKMVNDQVQRQALAVLLETLKPEFLALPERVIDMMPPQPIGYNRGRELFKTHTGLTFDPIGAAESSAANTIQFILNPQRLARVVEQSSRFKGRLTLNELLREVVRETNVPQGPNSFEQEVARMVQKSVVNQLIGLAANRKINQQVSASAMLVLSDMELLVPNYTSAENRAHRTYLFRQINMFNSRPDLFKLPETPKMPDGSPIGSGFGCGHFH